MKNNNEYGFSLLETSISMLLSTLFIASVHIEVLSVIKLWVNTSTLIDIKDKIYQVEQNLIKCSRNNSGICPQSDITRIQKESNSSPKLNICIAEEKRNSSKGVGVHIFASYFPTKNEEINNQLANNIIGGLSGFFVSGKGYQSSLNTWFIPENKICGSVMNNYNQVFIYDYISLRG
ncbi:TPA: hypothetical protein KKL27_004255 [Escherichia coli]|uniref:hypothetical protein n=1 Tax=Escherichia coli TaxID=562 RepID=UPI0015F7A9DD|nr:hypothetical protein [Escherichia coli]EFZ2922778.1 hypothetical protein [Shigella dysenteriae]EGW8322730.1 hypothetical protein [Escherichia coli]EJF8315833.1 hypothetical protein [Escherichia coli]MBL7446897.1 hypothetical protein [Escherichia coli]MCB6154697.1 hypothetical protein [Escherichia coli]